MRQDLRRILESFQADSEAAQSLSAINDLRVKYLGKNGEITAVMRGMKDIAPDERPAFGKEVNEVRSAIEGGLETMLAVAKEAEIERLLKEQEVDITLPSVKSQRGSLHPHTAVRNKIIDFFMSMGFSVEDGPEIETEYYNFTALNIPDDHPSKDMQDTFYLTDNLDSNILLRSQTSNTQIRVMEKSRPPIKMLNPGRVYRSDDIDATHSPMFHQIEGLVVDKGITMCDLKGTLDAFAKHLFGAGTKTRLRPSFFPFTEPSVEVDASCAICGGSGTVDNGTAPCRVCKGGGWIEILGAGMVNPKVLENCGVDTDVYSGFAFGMGLDRITNILYGITDLRVIFENDLRFVKQFR